MSPLAGSRGDCRPGPAEICQQLAEDLDSLEAASEATGEERAALLRAASEDIQEQLQFVLGALKEVADSAESSTDNQTEPWFFEEAEELLALFLGADLLYRLVTRLSDLEFEARKDVIGVLSVVVRLGPTIRAEQILSDYVESNQHFFQVLVEGFAQPEICTQCGIMLRSCARLQSIVAKFLSRRDIMLRLLSFTRHGSFDISSEAFSSLHDFLLIHKNVSADFLENHFQEFFSSYNSLLESDDYITQRQALKLLSEMLLDRHFMKVMLLYIGEESYLRIHMNLLVTDSKAIQLEVFHVFKIFVANPQKPPRVAQILYKNRERLLTVLERIGQYRPDDRQFCEDQRTVVQKLQALEPLSKVSSSGSAAPNAGAVPPAQPGGDEAFTSNPSASAADGADAAERSSGDLNTGGSNASDVKDAST